MNHSLILTFLTFTPFLGALFLLGLDLDDKKAARTFALAFSALPMVCLAFIWQKFDAGAQGLQLVERHSWIPSLGIEYFLGIDGMGFLMLLLSALVVPFAILATPKTFPKLRLYFALILFLQAGLFGTFTALNFFHWFIFWELSLIPAFFLIKLWGGGRSALAQPTSFSFIPWPAA